MSVPGILVSVNKSSDSDFLQVQTALFCNFYFTFPLVLNKNVYATASFVNDLYMFDPASYTWSNVTGQVACLSTNLALFNTSLCLFLLIR